MRNDNRVDRCAACGCAELFVRKDFPQRLGLLIVVVFGAIAIYFFTVSVLIALTILSAAFLLDVVIYLLLGKVTGCYACRAEYRKCILDPAHKDFDLAARGH